MKDRIRSMSLRLGLAGAIVGAALIADVAASPPAPAAAQSAGAPGGSAPVVTVKAPVYTSGQITITGTAVDCRSGQPASRVAIYDGWDSSAPYVADVSMDTMMSIGSVCPGMSGNARIGFTLIYNTRSLDEGWHDLLFNAEFPNGVTASTSTRLVIENFVPYEPLCHEDHC